MEEQPKNMCEVCGLETNPLIHKDCEHPKNGYCRLFRLEAEKDIKEVKLPKDENRS